MSSERPKSLDTVRGNATNPDSLLRQESNPFEIKFDGTHNTWPDGHERIACPMDGYVSELLELISQNKIVICQAKTGAGKTTRIPQALALALPHTNILVTQPRRAAVRWNSRRIADEMKSAFGDRVGYRLSRETPLTSNKTQVLFQIDQSVVESIRRAKRLPEGILVIDEAHERSISLDLLMGLVKEYLPNSPNTKVIITSATIDTEKFSSFFDDSPILDVPGRMYPVETPKIIRLQRGEHHSEGAARGAQDILREFSEGQLSLPPEQEDGDRILVSKGAVLVLLPGKEDIDNVAGNISEFALHLGVTDRVELCKFHGESHPDEQDAVQQSVPEGMLRFVIATEIARNSVTIPETIAVIDSLQVKRKITDATGIGHLTKIAVSKAEADQAKGRAGRTQPGIYIPVSFENEYNNLTEYPQPAILRESVESIVLTLATLEKSIRTFPFIDEIPDEKINAAVSRLQRIGALDAEEVITTLGRTLSGIPIDPEYARTLISAKDLGVLPEAILATAGLANEGIFYIPTRRQRDEDYEVGDKAKTIREGFSEESGSDFTAIVNAYRAYKAFEDRLRSQGLRWQEQKKALQQWCKDNFINQKRIKLMEDQVTSILDALDNTSLTTKSPNGNRDFNSGDLTKALITGLVDNVAIRDDDGHYKSLATDEFRLSNSTLCPPEQLILVGGYSRVSTKDRSYIFSSEAAPLQLAWLQEMMPHLYKIERSGKHTYDYKTDTSYEEAITSYSGLMIGKQRTPSLPEDAAFTFAHYLARNRAVPDNIFDVVRQVHAQSDRAYNLNNRAGKELFPYGTSQSLEQFIREKIPGISCAADISDPTILQLPAIDEDLVAKVERENPTEIIFEGETYQVEYGWMELAISLPDKFSVRSEWRNIPDHIKLPSDREVLFILKTPTNTIRGTSKEIKEKLLTIEASQISDRLRGLRKKHFKPAYLGGWVDVLGESLRNRLFYSDFSIYAPDNHADIENWLHTAQQLVADIEIAEAESDSSPTEVPTQNITSPYSDFNQRETEKRSRSEVAVFKSSIRGRLTMMLSVLGISADSAPSAMSRQDMEDRARTIRQFNNEKENLLEKIKSSIKKIHGLPLSDATEQGNLSREVIRFETQVAKFFSRAQELNLLSGETETQWKSFIKIWDAIPDLVSAQLHELVPTDKLTEIVEVVREQLVQHSNAILHGESVDIEKIIDDAGESFLT